mgnify:CR=1 FL=1
MDLNKLKYPMFKITLTDAYILTELRKYLHSKRKLRHCYGLCRAISILRANNTAVTELQVEQLRVKIEHSLGPGAYLNVPWFTGAFQEIQKVRRAASGSKNY